MLQPIKKVLLGLSSTGEMLARRLLTNVRTQRYLGPITLRLLTHTFFREEGKVFIGTQSHRNGAPGPERYRLRRNIHRLEKGLTSTPLRLPFGSGYLLETIDLLERSLTDQAGDSEEHQWALSVVEQTLTLHAPIGCYLREHARFDMLASAIARHPLLPYAAKSRPPAPSNALHLLEELGHRRRSVRWFQQTLVPKHLIEAAVDVARQSASACNRQAFRVVGRTTPSGIAELAELAPGAKGFAKQIPMILAFVGNLAAYESPRDRHLIYIDAALFASALMLALEAQGLSSCPINWPDIASLDRAGSRRLKLQPAEQIVMLLAVGYADPEGLIPFSSKKPVEQLLAWQDADP